MAKYTKKPVTVEAIQYLGYMTDEVKNFIGDSLISENRWGDEGGPVGYFIKTLEGTSYMLDKNDWIIKGVKGEFYPCKPDIFEMTYNTEVEENKYDPYCPVCSGCGEEGCCSPLVCDQSPEGHYCESYLRDLKFGYKLHKWLIERVEFTKEQADLYDEYWEKIYDEIYKDN